MHLTVFESVGEENVVVFLGKCVALEDVWIHMQCKFNVRLVTRVQAESSRIVSQMHAFVKAKKWRL